MKTEESTFSEHSVSQVSYQVGVTSLVSISGFLPSSCDQFSQYLRFLTKWV